MKVEVAMSQVLSNELKEIFEVCTTGFMEDLKINLITPEWMKLQDGAKYAGVSVSTFRKWISMGLEISVIEGYKSVSKTDIDDFKKQHKTTL